MSRPARPDPASRLSLWGGFGLLIVERDQVFRVVKRVEQNRSEANVIWLNRSIDGRNERRR